MRTRSVKTDGLSQSILEAGYGDPSDTGQKPPLVLLIHGFPELAISWRAQVQALGAAGYHVVAPDMRGYGGTDKPQRVEDYTILHLVGDMVDLVRALGYERCVVVGHDWGAPVAWHCALMRPDLFRAVAGLSVPFQPRRASGPPFAAMQAISDRLGQGDLYILRYRDPDAHREWEADPETSQTRAFYSYDGATPVQDRASGFLKSGTTMFEAVPAHATRPPWMSANQLAEYVAAFRTGGYFGPFNWYRCLDINWSLTAHLQNQKIAVPALFMVGEVDPVRNYAVKGEAELKHWVPGLVDQIVVPGAGHWLQQERAEIVTETLLAFIERH